MRWLLVHPGPDFSVHDVFEGWREALTELGEKVTVYNLHDRLNFYHACYLNSGETDEEGYAQFRKALDVDQVADLASQNVLAAVMAGWPDVVMVISGLFIPWQVLAVIRARGIPVVMVHTETPYEDPRQLELSEHASITLVNDPVTIADYREVCDVVEYVPHAYRPSVHYPRPMAKDYDLVFSGTGYESRIGFFEGMGLDGLKVGLAGNWQALPEGSPLDQYLLHDRESCLDNAETAGLYSMARAGVNLYRQETRDGGTAEGWAMGPREVEMAACGLFFLRDPRGEGDDVLHMLPVFTEAAAAGELLRWSLARPGMREDAVARSRAAIESRTFSNNARMLLRLLERHK